MGIGGIGVHVDGSGTSDPAVGLLAQGAVSLESVTAALLLRPEFQALVASIASNSAGDAGIAARFPIGTSDIGTNVVTSGKLATGAVTSAKLASDALASIGGTVTSTKSAAYTASPGDVVPVDASGAARTITLPPANRAGDVVTVKKVDSSTNLVTIARSGSDVINTASTSLTLSLQNQAVSLRANGSGAWVVQSGDLPFSSLQANLSATYAPILTGNTFVIIGSSIELTASNATNYAQNVRSDQWPTYFEAYSLGRVRVLRNAGVSGDTSAQMLARFTTDVLAYKPLNVLIAASPNDTTLAQTIAGMTAMATLARQNGIKPWFTTHVPSSDATGNGPTIRAKIAQVNGWVADYGQTNGIPVIDFFSQLVDPTSTTAYYRSGYNADVTHPSSKGQRVLGQYAATFAADILNPVLPYLASTTGDPSNLFPNALNLNSSGGVPSGWGHNAAGTGTTPTIVTNDSTIAGNWFQIARTGTDIDVYGQVVSKGSLWATGDIVEFSYLLSTITASEGSFRCNIPAYLVGHSGSPQSLIELDVLSNIDKGLVTGRVAMPSDCTGIQVQVRISGAAGTVKVGQFTLRNLTALGLA